MFKCKTSGLPKENESFITRTDQLDSCNSNKLTHSYNILYLLWGIIKKVLFFPVLKNFKVLTDQHSKVFIPMQIVFWKTIFSLYSERSGQMDNSETKFDLNYNDVF